MHLFSSRSAPLFKLDSGLPSWPQSSNALSQFAPSSGSHRLADMNCGLDRMIQVLSKFHSDDVARITFTECIRVLRPYSLASAPTRPTKLCDVSGPQTTGARSSTTQFSQFSQRPWLRDFRSKRCSHEAHRVPTEDCLDVSGSGIDT